MGLVTLNVVGGESVSKTLTIYSNTSSEQLFTATWNIGDSLYNDSPTVDTDWTTFKSAYVTAGGAKDELTIDLEQWAEDNGSVFGGADHSFTITSFCNSAECQSNLTSNTYAVAVEQAPQTYIIVLAGDSEMVGRANDKTTPPDTTDTRIKQLGRLSPNNNTVILADDPLEHNDTSQASNAIGCGMSYARALLPNIGANDEIILVPVAKGGSGFYNGGWIKGGSLYNDAITRANLVYALDPSNSTFIWVSSIGINDGTNSDHANYESNFDEYDYDIRQDLTGNNYEMLHQIVGIGSAWTTLYPNVLTIKNIQIDTENRIDNVEYVQWDDHVSLGGGDNHADGDSLRTIGARLYTNKAAFTPTPQPIPDVPSNLTVTPQDSQALVVWDLVNNADSYVLEYKLDTDTTFTEVLTTSVSNTITGLTNGSLYNFRVKSRNTIGDSAYTSEVDSTPVASLTRESGAEIHHVFGTDYATWEDIQGGGALTPVNTSPSNSTGYTATAYSGTNGLESAIPHDTTGKTVIAVVKIPETTNGTILMGNINASGTQGGWGIYESADEIKVLTRGLSNVTLKSTTDYTNYIFIAFSMDGSSHLAYYDDSLNGKTTLSLSGSIDSTTRNICVGNGFFTNTSFLTGVRIAEFIIFDSAKTESELDDIKARSTTRLAARGITV